MGPASTKLQELHGDYDAFDVILETICTTELIEMKGKFMRLNVDSKDNLHALLGIEDIYDTLESEETAKEFIEKLEEEQKWEMVKNLFEFLGAEANQIDLEEPPTPNVVPKLDGELYNNVIPEVPETP